jgi:hypothetical protein
MKSCRTLLSLLGVVALFAGAASAQTGNGGPSGPHYNLNIIGVKNKTAEMTSGNGHVIFVPLEGKANIWLCNSSSDTSACSGMEFAVLDANGTDTDGATFALPAPDPDNDGTTDYSVFARALGNPEGFSLTRTCATDPDGDLVCSELILELNASERPSKFTNVSKYLLYVYADTNDDGHVERIPLFWDGFEDFFWEYDNHRLRLAQLRFYPCNTTVTTVDDTTGQVVVTQTDNCGRTGNGN